MAGYDKMVGEQEDISRQMMDPNSMINRQQQNMMRNQNFDTIGAQNQGLMGMASMGGVSGGQAAAQARANMTTGRGQMGQQFGSMLQSQHGAGLDLFSRAMSGRQQIGERGAQMYMEQINAHNAARQQNQAMAVQLAGAAMSMGAAGIKPPTPAPPTSDMRLKENIELVDKSKSGINIYEFDYKNKSDGKGRYRGVMAQEVPNARILKDNGFYAVDYNKLDVNFERIG